MSTAVVLLGHGSRAPEARQYFLDLAAAVRGPSGSDFVEAAFLELCGPSFPDTVAACVAPRAAHDSPSRRVFPDAVPPLRAAPTVARCREA